MTPYSRLEFFCFLSGKWPAAYIPCIVKIARKKIKVYPNYLLATFEILFANQNIAVYIELNLCSKS